MSFPPDLAPLAALGLKNRPVAVGFLSSPPAGLPHVDHPDPAGCGYWKDASEGRAFYTTGADHQNCPVGAFTHGVMLSPEKNAELQSLVGTMIELKYLDSAEVAQIPHRSAAMKIAAYAPLGHAPFTADVVIFRGNVRQIMLLSEAARAAGAFLPSTTNAGAFERASVMGRPACAMIPAAADGKTAVVSVGCVGNRVYTGLGDDEMYLTVPGSKVDALIEELDAIMNANRALEAFHEQRARQLA